MPYEDESSASCLTQAGLQSFSIIAPIHPRCRIVSDSLAPCTGPEQTQKHNRAICAGDMGGDESPCSQAGRPEGSRACNRLHMSRKPRSVPACPAGRDGELYRQFFPFSPFLFSQMFARLEEG